MKSLFKLIEKIKFNYFHLKVPTYLIEDDFAAEEYHNPYLGIEGFHFQETLEA